MARKPEVADRGALAAVLLRDEDVPRLHVAVHEPDRVSRIECGCDLLDELDRALGLEPPLPPNHVAQIGAVDVLHDQIEDAVVLAGSDVPHDVRVVEGGCEP